MSENNRMDQWTERMTRRPDPEPKLILIETCWQMRAPSGRILTCGVFSTDVGLEVRVGYADDLFYSRRVIDMAAARTEAGELRATVVAKGGFTEVATTSR